MAMGRRKILLTSLLSDAQRVGLAALDFCASDKNVYLIVRIYILYIVTLPALILSSSDVDNSASVFLGFRRGFTSDIVRRCKLSFRDGGSISPGVTLYGRSL